MSYEKNNIQESHINYSSNVHIANINDHTSSNVEYHLENAKNSESSHKKKQFVQDTYRYAYGICIAGAVISLLIAILGLLLQFKAVTTISLFLIIFGFISMSIFAFGVWAFYQYTEYVNTLGDHDQPNDQSNEREFLNIFIYLVIILLFVFFIMAIGSVAYKQEAKSYISALAQNETEWTKTFGNIKYSDLEKNLNAILASIVVFAFLMIGIIIAVLVYVYKALDFYRFVQTLVQFFCIIFFIIGAILLYLAIYANRYKDIVNANGSMPVWVPTAILATAVITLLIAIGGYWGIQQENKDFTFYFMIASAAITSIILIFSIFSFSYSGSFKSMFDGKCKNILDMMPEDFLVKYAGCSRKYVSTGDIEPSDCPKERILLAWDYKLKKIENMQASGTNYVSDIYGCYDNLCCTAAYNTLASKSNYLALIAIFLFFSGLICAIGSYFIWKALDDNYQKSDSTGFLSHSNKVMIALVASVLIVISYSIATLPEKPKPDFNIVEPQPSENTQINSKIILNTNLNSTVKNETNILREEIKEETKVEEIKGCGNKCPILRYNFELSSQDGSFIRNDTADFSNITIKQNGKIGDKYVVRFEGGADYLQTFTQLFEFVHDCPLNPSSIDVKVSGEVFPAPTSFIQSKMRKLKKSKSQKTYKADPVIQTSVNQTSSKDSISATVNTNVVDYSKLKIGDKFDVLSKNLDFSFVTNETQVIKGKVLKRIDLQTVVPIQNAVVSIRSLDFGQCGGFKLNTDINGEFASSPINIFAEGMTSRFQIVINSDDLTQYKKTVTTGGIGAPAQLDLGTIELWNPSMLQNVNLNSTILDAVNNKPLNNVKISVFQGFISVNNEVAQNAAPPKTSFIQETEKQETNIELLEMNTNQFDNTPVFKTSLSNENGVYQLSDLPPNMYTVIYEKDGYYREVQCINFNIKKFNLSIQFQIFF